MGALGNREVHTDHIDRLAREGLTFTHAYNPGSWSGAVCVASRTMLNTGRFLWHAQQLVPKLKQEQRAGRVWSELFRRAGYRTYFTGKWHVRLDPDEAFDVVRHVRPGMPKQTEAGYNRPIEGQPDRWSPYDPKFGGFWAGGKHWSEVLADDAVAFIDDATRGDEPFFMYLAFNASHDPRQSPREYVERYPAAKLSVPKSFLPLYPFKDAMGCGTKLRDERLAPFPRTEYAVRVHRQEYYALIDHMDDQIGRILDALRQNGLLRNTYIIFTADHGLAVGEHGLMGKQNMFDHSVRVPLIIRGPGITAGRRCSTPVYLQDVVPTSLDWAGIPVPEYVEFRSLKPLVDAPEAKHDHYGAIYGAYLERQRMITVGRYKLIIYPAEPKVLLFDLQRDPDELHDLSGEASRRPLLHRLFGELKRWQKRMGDTLELDASFRSALQAGASGR